MSLPPTPPVAYLFLVRPISVIASVLRFFVGNLIGVAILILRSGPLGIAPLRDAAWLALLWLPIALVYSAVVVAALRLLCVGTTPSVLPLLDSSSRFSRSYLHVAHLRATLPFGAIIGLSAH